MGAISPPFSNLINQVAIDLSFTGIGCSLYFIQKTNKGIFIMIYFSVALFAIGVFSVYMLIEFFEYLKKFHSVKWKELSFERPFGIAQENFYFYPIRPLKFIPFLFSKNDISDTKVSSYKIVLKLSLLAITLMIVIRSFMQMIF